MYYNGKSFSDNFTNVPGVKDECDCKLECSIVKYDVSLSSSRYPANFYSSMLTSINPEEWPNSYFLQILNVTTW